MRYIAAIITLLTTVSSYAITFVNYSDHLINFKIKSNSCDERSGWIAANGDLHAGQTYTIIPCQSNLNEKVTIEFSSLSLPRKIKQQDCEVIITNSGIQFSGRCEAEGV